MSRPLLLGFRILVVEDEYLLAHDLRSTLEQAGAAVVGPVGHMSDALVLVVSGERLDAAVLDINLHGEMAYPVADALMKRDVPFIFVTGYDEEVLPDVYAGVKRCDKPVSWARLCQLLSTEVGGGLGR